MNMLRALMARRLYGPDETEQDRTDPPGRRSIHHALGIIARESAGAGLPTLILSLRRSATYLIPRFDMHNPS